MIQNGFEVKAVAVSASVAMGMLVCFACGGNSDDRTGIAEVDRVIEAVEAEDIEALAEMVTYLEVPCGPPEGIPAPPQCPEGEPDGTPVDVWWSATCEGYYVARAETANHIMGRVEDVGLRLYAAFRGGGQLGLDADYTILYRYEEPVANVIEGQIVALKNGGIQSWTSSCGSIAAIAAGLEDGGAETLISPRGD